MPYIKTTIEELLEKLEQHNWRHWVYVSEPKEISINEVCLVIDTDKAAFASKNLNVRSQTSNSLRKAMAE